MDRRNLMISVAGGASLFTLTGYLAFLDSQEDNSGEHDHSNHDHSGSSMPDEIQNLQPLGAEFKDRVTQLVDDADVYIRSPESIVVHYKSEAEGESGAMTEFTEITRTFVDSIGSVDISNDSIPSLSMIATNLHAITPRSTIVNHINGDIDEDALMETIEIVGVVESNE